MSTSEKRIYPELRMGVPNKKLPPDDTLVRSRTGRESYWDRYTAEVLVRTFGYTFVRSRQYSESNDFQEGYA